MDEYYKKITEKINQRESFRLKSTYDDRYYIKKIKPFFVDFEIYYEVTFTRANDYVSKFDRIIAFTKLDITENYAVKLSVSSDSINILGKKMPIQIIDSWEVSIRPCELKNFAKIFGSNYQISGNKESYELMKYLTSNSMSLVELIDLTDWYYNNVKKTIVEKVKSSRVFQILDKCREMSVNQSSGSNVIRYLLHRLDNKIIKKQYNREECGMLSRLKLNYGCIPFDEMPFNSSLINHNPKVSDLFTCLDYKDRQHEVFARVIKNNTVQRGQLYSAKSDLSSFEDIDNLIATWNDSLYWKHGNRRLELYKTIYTLMVTKRIPLRLLKN